MYNCITAVKFLKCTYAIYCKIEDIIIENSNIVGD